MKSQLCDHILSLMLIVNKYEYLYAINFNLLKDYRMIAFIFYSI